VWTQIENRKRVPQNVGDEEDASGWASASLRCGQTFLSAFMAPHHSLPLDNITAHWARKTAVAFIPKIVPARISPRKIARNLERIVRRVSQSAATREFAATRTTAYGNSGFKPVFGSKR